MLGRPNGLPLSRPRAFRFLQRDAQRRAEPSGGSRGPAHGTRSAAAAELGGLSRCSHSFCATLATALREVAGCNGGQSHVAVTNS